LNNKDLHIARQKRGQIDIERLAPFHSLSDEELIRLLKSEVPTDRTIGAALLGKRKAENCVDNLCDALKVEKSLYSKIAICEALESIGSPSVIPLSKLLGTIGSNQETELPTKYFEKKSYPLARDIVARTLINIGKPAIDPMIELAKKADEYVLSQVIDTLGGLLSKTKEPRIVNVLMEIHSKSQQNKLLLWKTSRALSAMENSKTVELILPNLQNPNPAIVWETIRTLGLIATDETELIEKLNTFTGSNDHSIRNAAKDAIKRIELREKRRYR
jgi:HEAT repeat protein